MTRIPAQHLGPDPGSGDRGRQASGSRRSAGLARPPRPRRAGQGRLPEASQLDTEIDDADEQHDLRRAELARLERQALLDELASATGLRGRDRRLGDSTERARKTVTSRIRDTISRIQRQHPDLAEHLSGTITTGTWCCYAPTAKPASPGL
jgi:hypothetical protein